MYTYFRHKIFLKD